MKMKRDLLVRVVGLVVAACAVSAAAAEHVVKAGAGRLAVNFCRKDLVHFRYAPDQTAFVPAETYVQRQAIEKTDADYAPVAVRETATAEAVELATDGLAVRVDTRTLGVTILADGKPVFQSADEAFAANGEGRTASFVRDVAAKERFFGLGNIPGRDFTSLELRDRVYELWLSDQNVHAVVPLWYSSAGYGVYLCNSNRGRVSFKDDYSVALDGGEMNFYFLWGPSFKTILTNWSELAGRMHLPPRYALGLTYRGCGGFKGQEIVDMVKEQLDAGFALDVAGVEPGWHTRAYPCSFVWSDKFPDPKRFLDQLHDLGVKVNFWEHPYFSPACPIIKEIEPYGLWGADIAKAEGVQQRYGFGGLVPDFTVPAARDLYWRLHRDVLFDRGADGLKVDETDSWGTGANLAQKLPGGISCNAYHNLVGTLTCNLVHERFRSDYNRRTFNYSRGNWAGMQRWATSAYTDFYGFDQFVMSVIVQSFSGSYYTPEIRNRETPGDFDYMRRAQMMFLTPFPQSNEWQAPAAVTRRSRAVQDCYLRYNRLHYALVPYLYSLFREQNQTGLGVVRALPFEFPADAQAYEQSLEYLLGPALLVRPVAAGRRKTRVDVYLPAGASWIDLRNGAVHAGGQTYTSVYTTADLPLFVRAGAILPLGSYGRNTSDVKSPDLRLALAPAAAETSFTVYEDDGISFDYEKGVYAETPVATVKKDRTITVKLGARTGSFQPAPRSIVLAIAHRAAATAARLDGRPLAADAVDFGPDSFWPTDVIHVRLPDDGRAHTLELTVGDEPPLTVVEEAETTGTRYECEAAGNTFDGVEIRRNAREASGRALVRKLGDNGKYAFTMHGITVPQAGVYDVELVYANGDGPRKLRVAVNGAAPIEVWCPSSGNWSTTTSVTLALPFKAGANDIWFGSQPGDGWCPDLDCLFVATQPSDASVGF